MTTRTVEASVLLLVLALTGSASADLPHTHDGFYLRGDAGMGNFSAKSSGPSRSGRKASGTTFSWSVFAGGTFTEPCAMGGMVSLDHVYAASLSDEETGPIDASDLSFYHSLFGVFLDCYVSPDGGAHFWGALGPAEVHVTREGQPAAGRIDPTPDPSGIGFQFGAGYDAWVSDATSLGVGFRLAYSPLTVDEIGTKVDVSVAIPALVLTVTTN